MGLEEYVLRDSISEVDKRNFASLRYELDKPKRYSFGIVGLGEAAILFLQKLVPRHADLIQDIEIFRRPEVMSPRPGKSETETEVKKIRQLQICSRIGSAVHYLGGGIHVHSMEDLALAKEKNLDFLINFAHDTEKNAQIDHSAKSSDNRRIFLEHNRKIIERYFPALRGYEGHLFNLSNPIDELTFLLALVTQIPIHRCSGLSHPDKNRAILLYMPLLKEDEDYRDLSPQALYDVARTILPFGPHSKEIKILFDQTYRISKADAGPFATERLRKVEHELRTYFSSVLYDLGSEGMRTDTILSAIEVVEGLLFNTGSPYHLSSILDLSEHADQFRGMEREGDIKPGGISIGYPCTFFKYSKEPRFKMGQDKAGILKAYLSVQDSLGYRGSLPQLNTTKEKSTIRPLPPEFFAPHEQGHPQATSEELGKIVEEKVKEEVKKAFANGNGTTPPHPPANPEERITEHLNADLAFKYINEPRSIHTQLFRPRKIPGIRKHELILPGNHELEKYHIELILPTREGMNALVERNHSNGKTAYHFVEFGHEFHPRFVSPELPGEYAREGSGIQDVKIIDGIPHFLIQHPNNTTQLVRYHPRTNTLEKVVSSTETLQQIVGTEGSISLVTENSVYQVKGKRLEKIYSHPVPFWKAKITPSQILLYQEEEQDAEIALTDLITGKSCKFPAYCADILETSDGKFQVALSTTKGYKITTFNNRESLIAGKDTSISFSDIALAKSRKVLIQDNHVVYISDGQGELYAVFHDQAESIAARIPGISHLDLSSLQVIPHA